MRFRLTITLDGSISVVRIKLPRLKPPAFPPTFPARIFYPCSIRQLSLTNLLQVGMPVCRLGRNRFPGRVQKLLLLLGPEHFNIQDKEQLI
jgi:hypothetical protein